MPDSPETLIQLLRKMGHDMRVPLNTLISTSDMLVEGVYDPLTTKQARASVRLQRNSRRLLAMLDDFLTYVKADANDLLLTPKPFDPRERLKAWCDQVQTSVAEKSLTLTVSTTDAVPAQLDGDETLISRIVLALLWNAIAYTSQGEIRVKADWVDQKWVVCVEDSGSGISEADQPHLFEPFWRGEERPQMPTAGAGLGLPMALALARHMGGSLSLEKTGAEGSIFCMRLPLPLDNPTTDASTDAPQ